MITMTYVWIDGRRLGVPMGSPVEFNAPKFRQAVAFAAGVGVDHNSTSVSAVRHRCIT